MKYILIIIFLGAVGCSTPTLFDHKEQKQFEKDFEQLDKERIKEDEAAVAEVCDEPEDIKIHVETDEEYQKRVAEIEGETLPLGSDDMNSCPEDDAAEGFTVHIGDEDETSYEINSMEDMESLRKHAKEILKHQEDEELKELDELIKGQVIVDKQIAEESVMDPADDADFDLDFSISDDESSDEDTEVEEGDLPDLF